MSNWGVLSPEELQRRQEREEQLRNGNYENFAPVDTIPETSWTSDFCGFCGRKMFHGSSCTGSRLAFIYPGRYGQESKRIYRRIRVGKENCWKHSKPDQYCLDCKAPKGSYHHPGCDQEQCPCCGDQLIGCVRMDEGQWTVLPFSKTQ